MTSASRSSDAETPLPRPQADRADAVPVNVGEPAAEPPAPEAPADLTGRVHHGAEPAAAQVWISLSQTAISQIEAHATSDPFVELGGVLLGRAYHQDGRLCILVAAALPAYSDDHSAVHFTFTADVWAQIHRDRESQYPEHAIVGWFHTHPDLGVFYSGDDVVVHSVAFTLPWHVGLVVDPVRREAAFFGWEERGSGPELQPLPGYSELLDQQPTSLVPWQPAARAAVWSNDETLAPGSQVYLPHSNRPAMSPARSGIALTIGAGSMLLTLLVVLLGLWPLQRRISTVEGLAYDLSRERLRQATASGLAECPDPALFILPPTGEPGSGGVTSPTIGPRLTLQGVANLAEVNRYEIAVRLAPDDPWTSIATIRAVRRLGSLAEWQAPPTAREAGYELRLTPLDRSGQALTAGPSCWLRVPAASLE